MASRRLRPLPVPAASVTHARWRPGSNFLSLPSGSSGSAPSAHDPRASASVTHFSQGVGPAAGCGRKLDSRISFSSVIPSGGASEAPPNPGASPARCGERAFKIFPELRCPSKNRGGVRRKTVRPLVRVTAPLSWVCRRPHLHAGSVWGMSGLFREP